MFSTVNFPTRVYCANATICEFVGVDNELSFFSSATNRKNGFANARCYSSILSLIGGDRKGAFQQRTCTIFLECVHCNGIVKIASKWMWSRNNDELSWKRVSIMWMAFHADCTTVTLNPNPDPNSNLLFRYHIQLPATFTLLSRSMLLNSDTPGVDRREMLEGLFRRF